MLWTIVRAMKKEYGEKYKYLVYTGDKESKEEILERAKARFNIEISPDNLHFVRLKLRWLLEAERYPHFTMALQSLGSIILGAEALLSFTPQFAFGEPWKNNFHTLLFMLQKKTRYDGICFHIPSVLDCRL